MLDAVISSDVHAALDPLIQAEYKEMEGNEGKFILDVKPTRVNDKVLISMEDVGGLKKVVADYKTRNEKKAKELERFKDITDPEAAIAALKKLEEFGDIDQLDDKVKQQVEVIKTQLESKYEGQIKKLTTELTGTKEEVQSLASLREQEFIKAQAMSAFSKHGVIPDFSDVMMAKVLGKTRCKKLEGNKLSIEIVDDDGNARISGKVNSTDSMGLDEYVSEMKTNPSLAVCFSGDGKTGIDAKGGGGRNTGGASHKITESQARDTRLYRQAKDAAEKAGMNLQVIPD